MNAKYPLRSAARGGDRRYRQRRRVRRENGISRNSRLETLKQCLLCRELFDNRLDDETTVMIGCKIVGKGLPLVVDPRRQLVGGIAADSVLLDFAIHHARDFRLRLLRR